MSANPRDPSAGQPRNRGRYDFRTAAPAGIELKPAEDPVSPAARLLEIADSAVEQGVDRDIARSYMGLRLVADVGQKHAVAGKAYLQAGQEIAATEFAISGTTLLDLTKNLAKAETMEARRMAVVNAGNQLRGLGGMLETVKGRPIEAFEHVRGVLADLAPLYTDGPDDSDEEAGEKTPRFAGLAETNRGRRGHDFYGPELG